MPHTFELSSELAISPDTFWEHATLADVNAELAPWVRMTAPRPWKTAPLRTWPAGRQLFRSWILLFGVVPVDVHTFCLVRIEPSSGFDERSTSLVNRIWAHSRSVQPSAQGCIVTDRVTTEARLPVLGALLAPVYRAIFSSRHRYLRRLHPGAQAGDADPG